MSSSLICADFVCFLFALLVHGRSYYSNSVEVNLRGAGGGRLPLENDFYWVTLVLQKVTKKNKALSLPGGGARIPMEQQTSIMVLFYEKIEPKR